MFQPPEIPQPRSQKSGWKINLEDYTLALEWIKTFITRHYGITVNRIVHEPDLDAWRFFEDDQLIVVVEQELMDRALAVLLFVERGFKGKT